MIRKIFIILTIFSLTSCAKNWYKPYGELLFRQMPKGGTPGYNLGWIHGCQSGLGTSFTNGFYQSFYQWSRDVDITSSNPDISKIRDRYKKELKDINWNDPVDIKKNFSDYNTIFWGAHAFCRHSALGIIQTSGMSPKLPGDERYNPADTNNNIGAIYRMTGRGDSRIGTGFW